MELLVCAATWIELSAYGNVPEEARSGLARCQETGYLLTGVGVPFALEAVLEAARDVRPDAILNIGIAGAYPRSGLALGEIVTADSEVYGDLGMELPEQPGFVPLSETPYGAHCRKPFPLIPYRSCEALAVRRGCTVSTCTGTEETGELRERLHGASFETMEGAAVAHAGQLLGISVTEVRAISNRAAHRSMEPENIRKAIVHLREFFNC